ncbi:leucine-rich repeat protein [Metamycoplasma hominis]|uniref:leucine-rich repeat protein n=1 Tax=Metamycoplasma hominis TaxID=2098 RepID=UPI001E5A3C8C|nr:leucine-rich repeat protein [Metamycoplasma hominis]
MDKNHKSYYSSFNKRNWQRCVFGSINLEELILNEGLEWIDALVFDFSKISHISVNPNNKNFEIKDNFFIDKNNKKILAYLDKKTTKVTIPSLIKEIGKGAFYGSQTLKKSF